MFFRLSKKKSWFYLTLISCILFISLLFLFQERIFHFATEKLILITNERFGGELKIASAHFSGPTTIEIHKLSYKNNQIKELYIKKALLQIDWLALLMGYFPFDKIHFYEGSLNLDSFDKLEMTFSQLSALISLDGKNNQETKIRGEYHLNDLSLNSPAISNQTIQIPTLSFTGNIFLGKTFFLIDRLSTLKLNKIIINPFFKYTKGTTKTFQFDFNFDWLKAQDFFDSLPLNHVNALGDINVTGELKYNFHFYFDEVDFQKIELESKMEQNNFKILNFGKLDPLILNQMFVHVPFHEEGVIHSRVIGPENPSYIPLDNIPLVFQQAVIATEDVAFYEHRGFDQEAIKHAFFLNLKKKKFVLGASTISMQFVKNMFLNREKNLSRKFEELLLVWLIESQLLITKERILEIYLNIIEWGDNIYGIGEASRYYFDKSPTHLTLGESIFLASIIKNPKNAFSSFLPTGLLHPKLYPYFFIIGNSMVEKAGIESSQEGYGFRYVRLKKSLLHKIPTLKKT